MPPEPQFDLLLDAIVPLAAPRADFQAWTDAEWGRTLRVADWHRLSPVLHSYLRTRDGVPGAVRHALERAYLANSARTLFIRATRERVVDALAAAEVPVMLLKGAALVETVYADPGVREMLDIDLLVPADRMETATAALAPLGYRPAPDSEETSTELTPETHHDAPLVGDEQLVAVELHRHVVLRDEGSSFDIAGFWQRARSSEDKHHLLPAPEDLLLHVCLHFTRNRLGGSYRRRHTGGALAQVGDIARIVECQPVDWDRLAGCATAYGLGTRVFLALFAARTLGVAVPESALAALRPPRFDPALGRRLVALRVLGDGNQLPARSVRWMFAPSREVLTRRWDANPGATGSLARAYMRRARAHLPEARTALRRPLLALQDRRLNDQIDSLEHRR